MRTTVLALALAVGLLASASSAQTPDLSGTWTLDPSRSDPGLFGPRAPTMATPVLSPSEAAQAQTLLPLGYTDTLTISHTTLSLTLQRTDTIGGAQLPTTVLLDGIGRNVGFSPDRRVRGWTEAGVVIVELVKAVSLPGGDIVESRTTEKLSRNTDGTLTVERTIESAGARRTWRFTYQPAQ